jgi:hypothetical protein
MHTHTSMHVGMYACMRSESESECANQLSGILKKKKIHTCVSEYVCVYEERERLSVTLVPTAVQGCASDLCMCVRARACAGIISLISLLCLFVYRCTPWQKHINTHTYRDTCQLVTYHTIIHTSMHTLCVHVYICSFFVCCSEYNLQLGA